MKPFNDGIEILAPRAGFLAGRGANFTSQFGEDGLIQACLEKFWCENQWCFEVGAANGTHLSNTAQLRDKGWSCVLIEADEKLYGKLQQLRSDSVFTFHEKIVPQSLDRILKECKAPASPDLGVIDIDGQDYWIWKGLKNFQPRLMLVEFDYKSEEKPDWIPEKDAKGQATYKAILRLGAEKGYMALTKTNCNILFCRTDVFSG